MRPRTETIRRVRSLMAVALVAAAEALCQEKQPNAQTKIEKASPERRIVVSIVDRKLALVEEGRVVKIYRTAVGAPKSPTPAGTFTIVQRIPNPTWYGPEGKVIGPGKENPIGTRWLGLSRKGYGIHGTNVPSSIGKRASHGCVRMRNRDVEDLFTRVAVGDVVELHGARDAETARIFGEPAVTVAMAGGGD
ncbi:MAG TPA: L,D-transpeptidase [Bryobacteraceae bacterium]|nr:L,D-transpeptidase [Bryobacteraceae bacterium]